MMKHLLRGLFCSLACIAVHAHAQAPVLLPPDDRFKADLLVMVAHPDDETEIGAYLARATFDEKKRVAVVFGTRGNSGGNAEGQEQAASLGAIREIEARQAVAHFGITHVWFLNGLDTPGQGVLDSLETWNHGDSLDRLVRLVRLTRPSVIVTWLPDWVAGENHGDHQAAGVLATEAFDLSGDPTVFPEQLAAPKNRQDIANLTEGLRPWQTEKLYYMTDAAHTEFVKGKGPSYSATEISPSRHASYARLAAEECAYHLTQDDTGQMARTALAKNNLQFFDQPVLFIFGKSYVNSSVTADVFAGIKLEIGYQRSPGYSVPQRGSPHVELGGSWHFYTQFWGAHGIDHLAKLVEPEMMAKYASSINVPLVIENPLNERTSIHFDVHVPEGWAIRRGLPHDLQVEPHSTFSLPLELKTSSIETSGWKNLAIGWRDREKHTGQIRMRIELNSGAMPQ
jgi:LmbE family N-acetylglucosaminyl deacetylase